MTLFILTVLLQVQHSEVYANADDTHKFFVPVMVIAIIFAGIVAYMISIDRKISKLEKAAGKDKEV
jgi:hypothetical protein